MTREEFHSLALDIEDALFAADLKPSELRMARLVVKLSLRSERTTTPPMLQKDFGLLATVRETHVEETLGWLLGKKVIELEAPGIYRPNVHPQTWVVKERMTAAAREREAELLRDKSTPEFWHQEEIRAGDPRVAFPDAAVAVAAEMRTSELPKSGSRHETRVHARPRNMNISFPTESMIMIMFMRQVAGEGKAKKVCQPRRVICSHRSTS